MTDPPRPPDPDDDRKPVVEFTSMSDGQTVATRIPYGGVNVTAHDPDVGTADGSGIRWVHLVLSDESGRFLGARREYWSTYDWGLRLRSNRTYTLTAYAVSDDSGSGGWSSASITINTGGTSDPDPDPPTPPTTSPPPPTPPGPAPTAPPAPTTSTSSPEPAPDPGTGDYSAMQQEVLRLTNVERANAGCAAVSLDPQLTRAAQGHTDDMAANGYFSHTGRDGSSPSDRARAAGFQGSGVGENIAQGQQSAVQVIRGWMNSLGHRRNLLDCSWTRLGVGHTAGANARGNIPGVYWAQVFAR